MRTEDPSVASVEEILAAAASTTYGPAQGQGDRLVVAHAIWLCACSSLNDAPTWLIHDVEDGGFAWRRMPNGVDVPDLVVARSVAGSHVHPDEVLAWLEGEAEMPWSDEDDFGDPQAVMELGRRIRG